jgi:hypothetical protein
MPARVARASITVVLLLTLALARTDIASAVGPGTFTKITTPSTTVLYQYDGSPGATNTLHISGATSNDVTSVDIDCFHQKSNGSTVVVSLATGVPVAGGSFSTVANTNLNATNCQLRAVPLGVDITTDYLGSYTGPIYYSNGISRSFDGGTPFAYSAYGGAGSGAGFGQDAGSCGAVMAATIATPAMQVVGSGQDFCAFYLPYANVTSDGSAVRVDGHDAYLPAGVNVFLNHIQGLTVTQSRLTTTFSRMPSGNVTVTESEPLVRCSADDSYPPTSTSCPDVVNTGVTFARTLSIIPDAHRIRLRDSYRSTDGNPHTISAQYVASPSPPDTGATGYAFPGHGSTYATATPGEVVTGLGPKAGTVLVRSDIYAVEDDPVADTLAFTWSRPPTKVRFSSTNVDEFAMPYSLNVTASKKAYVGFAVGDTNATSAAKKLAIAETNEMVLPPRITSPNAGATITGHLTTVKGTASLGANGMPTSVTVNGHAAKLTKVNATTDSYAVTFSESYGKHQLTVTASDVVGNTRSTSRTITNTS